MLIEKFIEYLQIEKKYSVNTLHAYKKDLAEFQEFIYENYDKYVIENVDYKVIRSWIVQLVKKNLSNRPKLSEGKLEENLKQMYIERIKDYKRSHFTINVDEISIPEAVAKINKALIKYGKFSQL